MSLAYRVCFALIVTASYAWAGFCTHCGQENERHAQFCSSCGKRLAAQENEREDPELAKLRNMADRKRAEYTDALMKLHDRLDQTGRPEEAGRVKSTLDLISSGLPRTGGDVNMLLERALFEFAGMYRESILRRGERFATAAQAYEILIQLFPRSEYADDAAYWLGYLYESKQLNDLAKSIDYYHKCFAWNPDTQLDPRLRIGLIYEKKIVKIDEAIRYYRKVLDESQNVEARQEAMDRLEDLAALPVTLEPRASSSDSGRRTGGKRRIR